MLRVACYIFVLRITHYALRYRSSRMALAWVMAAMWAAGVGKPAPMVLMPRWVAPRSRQARAFAVKMSSLSLRKLILASIPIVAGGGAGPSARAGGVPVGRRP